MEALRLDAEMDPQALPLGTRIGPWRVVGFGDRGVFGVVYRAVRVDREADGPAALKLAVYPRDPRFEREGWLLRNVHHPSVPRLLDAGQWRHFFLMDFGVGHYPGAERLTPTAVPPGTPAYNSPEVWDYARRYGQRPYALYVAGPADDVFAFGVMAYRLVTDEYPPFTDSIRPEGRCWQPGGSGPRTPKELNPRADPQLDALIMRVLSLKPGKRGTAAELAEALEQRVAQAGPEAHAPLFEWETLEREKWSPEDVASAGFRRHRPRRRWRAEVQATLEAETTARVAAEPSEAEARTRTVTSVEPIARRDRNQSWQAWLAVAAVGTVMLWPQRTGPGNTGEEFIGVRCSSDTAGREAGSVSLGDTSVISAEALERAPSKKVVALEVPPPPQPGQLKPDANGRCRKGLIAINGGCWLKASVDLEICAGNGYYVYRGSCYVPMFPPTCEPTSAPMK